MGAQHVCRFTAPLPFGEGHRLGPDPVKAELDELLLGPDHRTGIGLACGHAWAELGGQRLGHVPAGGISQCLLAQLHSRIDGRLRDDGLGAGAGAGQGSSNGEGKATHRQACQKQTGPAAQRCRPRACTVPQGLPAGQARRCAYFFRLSRISRSSSTSSLGSAGAAGSSASLRARRLSTLISMKMAKATMMNWMTVLMNSP